MSIRGITNTKVVDEIIIYLFSCLICSSTEGIEEENKLPNPYKAVQKKIFVRLKKTVIWFLQRKHQRKPRQIIREYVTEL